MSELRPLPAAFFVGARDRLRARAEAAGLDGLLLLRAPNLAYATGLFLSANERPMGVWLPVAGDPILMLPGLERENAVGTGLADLTVEGRVLVVATILPDDRPCVRLFPETPSSFMCRQNDGGRVRIYRSEVRLVHVFAVENGG